MSLSFNLTAASANCGAVAACSGATLAVVTATSQMVVGGLVATLSNSVTVTGLAREAAVMYQSIPGAFSSADWPSGTYTIRLNITVADIRMEWDHTYICRMSSACGSLETIGSLTNQSISLGTTGIKTMSVSGVQAVSNLDDTVYIVLVFQNTGATNRSVSVRFNQAIDTPLINQEACESTSSSTSSATSAIAVTRNCSCLCSTSSSSTGAATITRYFSASASSSLAVVGALLDLVNTAIEWIAKFRDFMFLGKKRVFNNTAKKRKFIFEPRDR